ncbi:MAG: phosphotransferase [Deltaproteobacteria bacterium]|nr:phosphotransferase [Deltaproteobacteria bacterium]
MVDSELQDFVRRQLKSDFSISPLKGDGSERSFFRVSFSGGTVIALDHRVHPAEAESYFRIGTHLLNCGIPVPHIITYERGRFFLLEDLGDWDLYRECRHKEQGRAMERYCRAVDLLVRLQLEATPTFDVAWCFDTSCYTGDFAYEREGLYFLDRFVKKGLGLEVEKGKIAEELRVLAQEIDRIPFRGFMHRDFQSRNLMMKQDRLIAIDFQGARIGPPQYDLVSLLYDPYVMLDRDMRGQLIERYVQATEGTWQPVSEFLEHLGIVALHRLMQALGAFAVLGVEKGKPGFREHIPGAVAHLVEVWEQLGRTGYPAFNDLIDYCANEAKARFPSQKI